MADDNTCPVCWENYTSVKRKKVQCPKCKKYSCVICLKQSIKDQGITNTCPILNCNFEWTIDFIRDNFPKSFVDGELKDKKKQLYLAREKTFLPEAMEELERMEFIRKLRKERSIIERANNEISRTINSEVNKIIEDLTREYHKKTKELRTAARQEINSKIESTKEMSDIIWFLDTHKDIPIDAVGENHHDASSIRNYLKNKNISTEKTIEKKCKYIYPCGTNNCNGFLNHKYKCAICKFKFCSKCFGRLEKEEEHVCKEEDVASATLIKNSTKPCPNCHTRIFKISGCDQMWCTFCHVAFSWNKGTIEKGRIHNPEYTKYMQSRGASDANNYAACDGQAPPLYMILRKIRDKGIILGKKDKYTISKISALIDEIRQYTLPSFTPNETKHKELRFQYIKREIDDQKYKTTLMKFERSEEKNQRIYDYLDTFVKGATDIIINLSDKPSAEQIALFHTEITSLITYVNDNIKKSITKMGYKSYPVIYVNPKGWIGYLSRNTKIPQYEKITAF